MTAQTEAQRRYNAKRTAARRAVHNSTPLRPGQPEGTVLGWKVVRPDFTTTHDYRWPFPGNWAESSDRAKVGGPCPRFEGDGLCIAKTWAGAASGGIPAVAALLLAYYPADVLGQDSNKIRVRRAFVLDIYDPQLLIRQGWLTGANLYRANLTRANLYGADLAGANLAGADLAGANLYGANLTRADLAGANLDGADLTRANLYGANLTGANLTRANLYGANNVKLPDGWSLSASGLAVRS